jgi:hypothetical protein
MDQEAGEEGRTELSLAQSENLEALRDLSTQIQMMNRVVDNTNDKVTQLSQRMRQIENTLNTVYMPFKSSIYEIQRGKASKEAKSTNAPKFV